MKTLRIAISLSILLHLLILALMLGIKLRTRANQEVEIDFSTPEAVTVTTPAPPQVVPEPQPEAQEPEESPSPETSQAETPSTEPSAPPVVAEKTVPDTADTFNTRQFFAQSPFMKFKKQLDELNVDTTKTVPETLTMAPPFFTPQDSLRFRVQPGPVDKVQDDINKRNTGTQAPLPLNRALQEGAQYLSDLLNKDKEEKPVRLTFIPSESELAVLKVLWENPKVTDHDIYTSMDTSVKITAEGLNKVLDGLTEKGLLQRQVVSPRNEFTLPVGKVEMSAKNRRNRVYEYQTRVKSEDVLRYLNAMLYQVEHDSTSRDSERRAKLAASLKEKILSLMP